MICHKYKCILIHIPRCAGSSMEYAIANKNWWSYEPSTKHILASTAKTLYAEYWDDYFKFSFVRNPWSRMLSMSKFANFYGCKIKHGKLDVKDYFTKFKDIEIDPRSESLGEEVDPVKNAVYLNILNEEIDFIGRFENLQQDFGVVCDKIGIPRQQLPHKAQYTTQHNTTQHNTTQHNTTQTLH